MPDNNHEALYFEWGRLKVGASGRTAIVALVLVLTMLFLGRLWY